MIPTIVVPILMPIGNSLSFTGLVAIIVSFALCTIIGLTISYFAMRKHNQKSKWKVKFREAINPFSENYLRGFDNFAGEFISGVGIGGLVLMAFATVVFWITDLIVK